ncbi:FAD-dependent oxidoreductase [Candidatus Pelagibacter communis]|uniref:FAD-dependent oxidoreductase n=1 Tax=Pelagibacter ubique TaxID=198252 RepID=UPI00094C07B7|nr:FAD-dependent oxidoreductase [Candidatus Pelagibacter ubique]|tara:strand:+ start:1291 stop:2334 length:1044 start_codon:yes stop_codon:yes gene_type:complete
MKIAIIGAGFFGTMIAIKLSKKHSVHLFEKQKGILNQASKINQFRFHLGYHYPRSKKTLLEIKSSYKMFINFFSNKVFDDTKNYYAVSNKDSRVSFKKYTNILKKFNLYYKISKIKFPETSNLILTKEKILNYFKFKKILKKKLKKSNVKTYLNKELKKNDLYNYDKVIICTYSSNNQIIEKLGISKNLNKHRYELIEKILIKLPKKYKKNSYVVVDGKFVCLDPYLGTNYHLLSDVKHSKIEIVKKKIPIFQSTKKRYLDNKIHKNLKISNFKKFISHGSKYLPFLKDAIYIGSYFIIRTLKENVEKTDERTGEIQIINQKFISVLSGKWNTCVQVANKIDKIISK